MTVHKLSLKYGLDVKIIGVAVLYYLAARLGYFLAFHDSVALPAWPPSGVAFALTILLGRQVWPGIMIGSLVANILAFWNTGVMAPQSIIYISSCIAIGNTLEAVTGTLLLRTWIDSNHLFRQTRNAFRFLFTVVLMCLVGASMATISLFTNEAINSEVLAKTFFSGWIGNVVGILLFTPLILSAAQKLDFKLSTKKSIEMGIFFVCVLSVFLLLQIEYLAISLERALPFLILPFLLWLAFRFDLIVAMIGVVSASLVSIYFTNAGIGPFVLEQSEHAMWLLQIFISVLSASTIILSATVKERLIVQRKLEEFNENLESMVEQRTKALNEEIKIRRAAEKKLQGTNEELFKRNTELDNFVYSVSHDLRAPIASVLGLINLAKMDDDVTMKDMYLDMINNSALQQDIFIKEILDQSRNSRLELKREPVCFASLIDETFSQLKFATTTGKSVDKMISVKQDQEFYSDSWRLKVILNNIISNAIRYRNGRDPVIKIDVRVENQKAFVAIEDNGRGIEKEHLPNVYKMFYRATDDGAGSGLGLYIVKEAIDKLNGDIVIESEFGKGTTVTLEIPEIQDTSFYPNATSMKLSV